MKWNFNSSKVTPNSQKGDLKLKKEYPLEKDLNQTCLESQHYDASVVWPFVREHFRAFPEILT